MSAPYPNLDPDLFDIVRNISLDFATPPHLLGAPEFRRIMDELAARNPITRPDNVTATERMIAAAPKPVRMREYVNTSGGSSGVLMYMHGGGWTVGGLDSHDGICADLCAQTGMTIVSVDYSLSPENRYPVAFNECLAAYQQICSDLGSRYPNHNQIMVGGDSAGANLAAAICLKLKDSGKAQPAAQILIYPCLAPDFDQPSYLEHADAPFLNADLMRVFWQNYLGPDLAGDVYTCPSRAPDLCGLAPAVVMTAALDPLADEGDDFAMALIRSGVPVVHRRAAQLIHGYLRFRTASQLARDEFSFLTKALRLFEQA